MREDNCQGKQQAENSHIIESSGSLLLRDDLPGAHGRFLFDPTDKRLGANEREVFRTGSQSHDGAGPHARGRHLRCALDAATEVTIRLKKRITGCSGFGTICLRYCLNR